MGKRKSQILEQVTKEVEKSKFVDRNTLQINYKDGSIAYRLHDTDVVTVTGDKIMLTSGGWRTPTTKDRINSNTPNDIWVMQNNHIWYVETKKGTFIFYDGIAFNVITGEILTKVKEDNTKEVNKLKKDIKKYVNLIDKLDKLPVPTNGDCWGCLFKGDNGATFGELLNSDHLQGHIQEGYIFGAILVNAMNEAGYNPMQIAVHFQMNVRDSFKRALRKYLYKKLIK